MRALIVEDGYSRGALAAAQALAKEGWLVGIGSPDRVGFAAFSRWTSRWHRVPAPGGAVDDFVDAVNAAIETGGYDVVLPCGDAELLVLSSQRGRVRAKVPYAAHETVVRALDKLSLLRAAEAVGLATPRTVTAGDSAAATFGAPVIVKARLHGDPDASAQPPRLEAWLATTAAEADERIEYLRSVGAQPILQEVLEGRLVAFSIVADRSAHVVARVQQRAHGTWPPDLGASVRAETVPVDGLLAESVDRLVAELGWFGLAELQLIERPGAAPALIDLNGRLYGSLALAVAAGCDLPTIWARLAVGRDVAGLVMARPGVRYQWLEGDLRRVFRAPRGGALRDLLNTCRYAFGATDAIWRRNDRRPAVRYAASLARRSIAKIRR